MREISKRRILFLFRRERNDLMEICEEYHFFFSQNEIAFCILVFMQLNVRSVSIFLCFKIRNFRSDSNVLSLIHCGLDSIKLKFIAHESSIAKERRRRRSNHSELIVHCYYYRPFYMYAMWSFAEIKSSKKRCEWVDGKGKNAFYNAMAKVINGLCAVHVEQRY